MITGAHAIIFTEDAEGVRPITDQSWGLITAIELPDGRELALYEPRHRRPSAGEPTA